MKSYSLGLYTERDRNFARVSIFSFYFVKAKSCSSTVLCEVNGIDNKFFVAPTSIALS